MKFEATALAGVYLLSPEVFGDERGFFIESWNAATFRDAGFDLKFVQDNHSHSLKGTLRGLHYQKEQIQGKLVRVTAGEVFDVAVDLRRDSPTLGKWHGEWLSAENHRMLWIPPGFAHGFYVNSDRADFQYKCTELYDQSSEICLAWDDPSVGIDWPIPEGETPNVSEKDARGLPWNRIPLLD
ncbi:MAG: dTDP-4-dehydrorhamnose 3,5-epimerase [Pseudomonadota bacterium]